MSPFSIPELQSVSVSVSAAPCLSALLGIAALGTSYQHFGFGPQTPVELSAEEFGLNRVLFDVLGAALLPDDPTLDFEAYLAQLEAYSPEAITARVLPGPTSPEALLAQLSQQPDTQDLERALLLLANPALLKQTMITHLNSLWTRFLAEEWRKKHSLVQYIQRSLEERGLPQGNALTVVHALIGRDLPAGIAADLASVRAIVLVPSLFVNLIAIRPYAPDTLWLFTACNALTGWVLRQEAMKPGEVLGRIMPLADKARLQIIQLLSQYGELSSQQLIAALDLSQSVVSRHLSSLNGYVIEQRGEGANKFYRLNHDYLDWTLVMLRQFVRPPHSAAPVNLRPARYPAELRRFMNREHRLTRLPSREDDQLLALHHIAAGMQLGQDYSEREVNELIASAIAFDDFATIRRALVVHGLVGREKDGSRYWLIE